MTPGQAPLSRRDALSLAFSLGGAVAAGLLVPACSEAQQRLYDQVLGPFYPDPGDPVTPTRELGIADGPIAIANDWDLTNIKGHDQRAAGQVIELTGQLLGDNGQPQPNATIILWQANAHGRYNHRYDGRDTTFTDPRGRTVTRAPDPHFQHWGHALTDTQGRYQFKTVLPGYYPADLDAGWFRPPHLHFLVQAQGYPELVTQTYFKGEAVPDNDWIQKLNAADYILRDPRIPREMQERLIVAYRPAASGKAADGLAGEFDFHLRRA